MTRYCPAGDGAYDDALDRCPACGRRLVDRARDVALQALEAEDDPIVYLATVPSEPLAQMWADVLEDAGIRTLVKAIGPGFGGWGSVAMAEHELFVLRSQLPAANAVARRLAGTAEAAGDASLTRPRTVRAGARSAASIRRTRAQRRAPRRG